MRPLLFGKRDLKRQQPLPAVSRDGGVAFDTADSTVLLTPEFDKGNDDVTAIRSSLGLDTDKRRPASE